MLVPLEVHAQPAPLDPRERQVNTDEAGIQAFPSVAVDPYGNFVVAWESTSSIGGDQSGRSIHARRYRPDGLPLDPADFQVNTYTFSNQTDAAVATDAEGNFVVVWESFGSAGSDGELRSIQARRYDAGGRALDDAEFQVNTFTTGNQRRPSVTVNPEGDFVVVWDSRGSPWTQGSDETVLARRFGASGAPLDTVEFLVSSLTEEAKSRATVASDSRRRFVVTWLGESSLDVFARRFDFDGGPLETLEFVVNTYPPGTPEYPTAARPQVAASPGGAFVVSWESYSSPGTDQDEFSIQVRRFDEQGVGIGDQFQVNSVVASTQHYPSVTSNLASDFVVTWSDWSGENGDASLASAAQRRFRSDGSAAEPSEKLVNTYTSGAQWQPNVAGAWSGGHAVVWGSDGSWGSDQDLTSVQIRRFSAPTITVTSSSGGSGGPGCTLRDAITAANLGAAVGECPAGSLGAIIDLPPEVLIDLTIPDNGTNGLPVVRAPIVIRGSGSIIQRNPLLACPGSQQFRLFEVAGSGLLVLEDTIVQGGCVSPGGGGGILVSGGSLVLNRSIVQANHSTIDGGGISVLGGNLFVNESTVRSNVTGGQGGGIAVAGDVPLALIQRSTISFNRSASGGGLACSGAGGKNVRSSTIFGNIASSSGGGIATGGSAALSVDHSSVTGNSAPAAAGILLSSGNVMAHATLVGENLDGLDCEATGGSLAGAPVNYDTDGSCAAIGGQAFTTVPGLELGALSDNGGATLTRLPSAGSPVLDLDGLCALGSGAVSPFDQRGFPRPTDDDGDAMPECDLGPTERGPVFLDGFEYEALARWSAAFSIDIEQDRVQVTEDSRPIGW